MSKVLLTKLLSSCATNIVNKALLITHYSLLLIIPPAPPHNRASTSAAEPGQGRPGGS
jgi:hypothetical protein